MANRTLGTTAIDGPALSLVLQEAQGLSSKSKVVLISDISFLCPKNACHVKNCLSCKKSYRCFTGPHHTLESESDFELVSGAEVARA